jgi:hypothetical protein
MIFGTNILRIRIVDVDRFDSGRIFANILNFSRILENSPLFKQYEMDL